jgi:hypothetical protein
VTINFLSNFMCQIENFNYNLFCSHSFTDSLGLENSTCLAHYILDEIQHINIGLSQ